MAVAMSEDAAALTTTLDPSASWQERLRGWAHALRRSIFSHRDGAQVFPGTFAADPATFHVTEAALQAWQDAGLPRAESARRTVLLRHFIVGFCIEEQVLTELREALLHELEVAADPARFPLTSEAWPAILNTSAEERFELGLRLMLGGLWCGAPRLRRVAELAGSGVGVLARGRFGVLVQLGEVHDDRVGARAGNRPDGRSVAGCVELLVHRVRRNENEVSRTRLDDVL
jgi:TetR/AcrR family transcriptional regulator, tetracycline repressor protein